MATSNFHSVCSPIYAVEIDDEFEYEDLKYMVEKELSEAGFDTGLPWEDIHSLRSYPSRVLGVGTKTRTICNITWCVQCVAVLRSGYYMGVNLDYHLEWYADGHMFRENVFELVTDELNAGMAIIHTPNICEFLREEGTKMCNAVISIYKKYSERLTVLAVFSNGEAVYKQI